MAWTADKILAAIRAAAPTECISQARLVEITGLTPKQVENACQNLRRHGFISRTVRGCHLLTEAGRTAIDGAIKLRSGPKGPHAYGVVRRNPGLRQRVWNALRLGKKLTAADILMRVIDGDEKDPTSNVQKYLSVLARAGYIQAMATREAPLKATSNGCRRWLLITDSGPEAPFHRPSRGTLYDPNLECEIALARGTDGVTT